MNFLLLLPYFIRENKLGNIFINCRYMDKFNLTRHVIESFYDVRSTMLNLQLFNHQPRIDHGWNERKECCEIYYMQRTGAKNSEERIAYLRSRCSRRRPALRSLSLRAYICTVHLRSLHLLIRYSHTDFLRTTDIKRALQSSRKILYASFLCVKNPIFLSFALNATAKSSRLNSAAAAKSNSTIV